MTAVLLDVDGTLVDTNYQHALAWYRAFRAHGVVLPLWRIHRHIGMGGDQLVPALTDEHTERTLGDPIREREAECYRALIGEVEPMDGARGLLEDLRARGHRVILASSAKPWEIEHYVDLLDARSLVDGWTSAGDVEDTKPAPDLVEAALACAGTPAADAVMVGDSPWDVEASGRADVRTLAVMTGGFAREELSRAGAAEVFESVAELRDALDATALV